MVVAEMLKNGCPKWALLALLPGCLGLSAVTLAPPPNLMALRPKLAAALAARSGLMPGFAVGRTDCYRCFHGAIEGEPGLTIDRYGGHVLLQVKIARNVAGARGTSATGRVACWLLR